MREIFDCLDVLMCCSLSVITTLEFFEHHFAKVGHRLAPYDPTLFLHTHCRHLARESVCRHAASFKSASGKLSQKSARWRLTDIHVSLMSRKNTRGQARSRERALPGQDLRSKVTLSYEIRSVPR